MNNSSFPPAPLWRRLIAMVYDSLLLVAVILAYGYLHLGLKALVLGEAWRNNLKTAPAGSTADPLMFLGTLLTIYLFFYIFWRQKGQTLGMQVWRIRVQQSDGKPPTALLILIRLLVAPLSLVCFGMGYLWCLFGKKRSWHDLLSGTEVVLLPKNN